MKTLAGGCQVCGPDDGHVSTLGNCTSRAIISQRVSQTMYEYAPGVSASSFNPSAEEVLYVLEGEGICNIDGTKYPVTPGTGVLLPPGGVSSVENAGPAPLKMIGVRCPAEAAPTPAGAPVRRTVHVSEREPIRAGKDREFRLLVTTDIGSVEVTQFVGWIPPGKAKFHHHTYEEDIFILDGHGVLHLKGQPSAAEFGPGTSIYLPPGVVHCLENPGTEPIRLLGVFHPSGSPGTAYEDD